MLKKSLLPAALVIALAMAVSFTACVSPGGDKEPEQEEPKDPEQPEDPDKPKGKPDLSKLEKVSFDESEEIFLNPERGWYTWNGFYFKDGSSPSPLTKALVLQRRSEGFAIMHCIYHLTDFRNKPLSQSVLNVFEANMNAIREGGSKCTLRFSYTDWIDEGNKSIADAPLDVALGHIGQLKPLLQKHGDVIVAVEAGFVGTWGEWWWTEHYNFTPTTVAGYEPRRALVDALLDAVPEDRMICLRTARHKMLSYGLSPTDTITLATAHDGSDMSRLAAHNDCFLASADDWGTYDGGNPDRRFWEAETRYVVMGGETCNLDPTYTCCENAVEQLEKYHWTYLNRDYQTDVLNSWKSEQCYDEVQRRLGYRLVLREGYFTPSPSASEKYEVVLEIENVGFAAPVNPRGVEIVFAAADGSGTAYPVALDEDPRFWFAGETHTVYAELDLPEGMAPGKKYDVYLNLPDPKPVLDARPEYSIRLANKNMWNESTGYNKLCDITL